MTRFKALLAQYLATMPGNFRDGLFIAAIHAESHEADGILINAFSEWYTSGDWFPAGTGEDGSLTDVFHLVCKWEDVDRNSICGRMREVYRGYIQRHGDVAYFKKVGLW